MNFLYFHSTKHKLASSVLLLLRPTVLSRYTYKQHNYDNKSFLQINTTLLPRPLNSLHLTND